jgi:crotonobetainyl-CoA:carnitine CoA-transferase CaiB-like acyl-CoA transferase
LLLAADAPGAWDQLVAAVPSAADPWFATPERRTAHDDELAAVLGAAFAGDTAEAWGKTLDAHGVPAEVCAPAPGVVLFDDPDLTDRGLMSSYAHPVTGAMQMAGRLFDVAGARASGRPPLIGEHTREILSELGVEDVDALVEAGVVRDGAAT